jgi:two-component system cell cycle sensor histidine kinase PleC
MSRSGPPAASSLRPLVELHREAAVVVDADAHILAANARAAVALGAYGGAGTLFDLVAETPEEVSDLIGRVIDGPGTVPIGLTLRRDGRIEPRILRGAVIGTHEGRQTCLLVMSTALADTPWDEQSLREKAADLSRLNAQLVEAKQRAEEANQSKTEFLARVSHELRTPLNAIIGFSEMMSQGMFGPIEPPRYAAYVRDILVSGRHLLELVNDVLDLSKIEAGKMTLREAEIDLPLFVPQIIRLIEKTAAEKQLVLEVELAGELPKLVADQRAIRQMLLNLLSNAIKFTLPGGSVRLAIGVADGRLTVAVEDTGIGIAQENIAECFRPFDQVDNVLTRRFEGSGLGLAITKALIELHGGAIDLTSTVGVGTKVTLTFPRERTGDRAVVS